MSPYLTTMSIWKNVDPVGAIADFRTVFEQAGKNRWRIAVLAAAATIGTFSVMFQEEHRILPRPPKVTYITSWRADRDNAEIVATNRANQIFQDRVKVEQAKREAEVREIYKKIGRYSGMDVDAIEAKAKADQAAEDSAKKPAAATPATLPNTAQGKLAQP
ncbi:MAG: hypothetical protein JWQ16_353 [Novosphingobium sp.]|nr:hypothetical protein [Novosphingobium sp.]